jgi:hypothetical protein
MNAKFYIPFLMVARKYNNRLILTITVSILFLFGIPITRVNAQTETYTWASVAIGGGGYVTGIITSKTEQHLMYARTDVGGAYRWDHATNKWIPLLDWVSDTELGYLGVESIASDPIEPNKVYMLVGTSYFNNGKTAILQSTDYGNTFAVVNVTTQFKAHGNGMGRQTGEKLVVDPNNNTILFCGTRANGLFKSVNSGSTWSKLSSLAVTTTTNENGISLVVLDASTGTSGNPSQTLIVGVSQMGTNLYRSDDGGAVFTPITGAPTTLMPHRAVLSSDRNLYITYANAAGPWDIYGSGQIGQLWKYNLVTGIWTNVTPAGFNIGFGGISVDPFNANRLVASSINTYMPQDNSYGDRIFLSTDGGANWTDVVGGAGRSFDLDPNGISWVGGNAIHWAGSVEFDPFDTKKVWIVSGNGVFSTDDIDDVINNWKFRVQGMEETVPLDLVSIPNGPLVSVIGDYDGFRHTDITQYAPMHEPRMGTTTSIAFAAQNPKIMLRVGEKDVNGTKVGTMYLSVDMGVSWTLCTAKGLKGNLAITADGSVFFHCPEGSTTTYRSTDNGTSWTAIEGLTANSTRLVADPVNPKKVYVYNNGPLLISTDAGISFVVSGTAGSGGSKVIRTAPGREGDVWVPLNNGGLTRSINSGANFTKITTVSYCGAVGFGKEAPGKTYPTVYIWGKVSNVLGIYRSIDEGVTWTRINDDAHEYGGPANGQFVMGDMNVYGRVYMSTAGRGIIYGESDKTCFPTTVVPNIKINTETSKQTTITPLLAEGSNVVLSPTPINGGAWRWSGPNNFSSTDREITLPGLQESQAGIYSVRYTNSDGCESAAQTFTVNIQPVVTAIDEMNRSEFDVHPNPVTSMLYIDRAIKLKHISILDVNGKTLYSFDNDKGQVTLDLAGLPAGIYVLKLRDSNRHSYQRIIVGK